MEKKTEKQFNQAIAFIKKGSDALASAIHTAGLYAIAQVNEHGNTGFGTRLIEAMGKKHDAKRVAIWLCAFGKFTVKKGELVYCAKKNITPESLEAMLEKADATPYWELTKQPEIAASVDYQTMFLAGLRNIIKKHDSIQAEGKETEEKNIQFVEHAKKLLEQFTAPAPAKA